MPNGLKKKEHARRDESTTKKTQIRQTSRVNGKNMPESLGKNAKVGIKIGNLQPCWLGNPFSIEKNADAIKNMHYRYSGRKKNS